jgi:hypothetical protein
MMPLNITYWVDLDIEKSEVTDEVFGLRKAPFYVTLGALRSVCFKGRDV